MNAKAATVSNVVTLPRKGDKEQAANAHAAERAAILENIDTAEDLLGTALIEGLRMTVQFGPTSAIEVRKHYTRCGSPDVYASWFNLGDKAQAIVGQKLALKAITDAAALGTGSMFQRAREALSGIVQRAKSAGVKELGVKPATEAVKASVAEARAKAETRRATKKSTTTTVTTSRGVKAQDTATMATAALECGKGHREMAAFVKLASQNAHRLPAPVGRESAHRDALAALSTACELWSVFAK